MLRLRCSFWTALLAIAVTASTPLVAQISTSSLTGQVTDPSGSTVAHAHIAVLNKSTGFSRSGDTDDAGFYNFQALPIGLYTITVEDAGFASINEDVQLNGAEKGRRDFVLAIGGSKESVTVSTTDSALSPDDASISTVIGKEVIEGTPLYQRNWDDLLRTVAGVQIARFTQQGGATSSGRIGSFNVHGVHSLQNNFILDGIDNNTISENVQELSTQAAHPSVDTIQQFTIVTAPTPPSMAAHLAPLSPSTPSAAPTASTASPLSTCATSTSTRPTSSPSVRPTRASLKTTSTSSAETSAVPSFTTVSSSSSTTRAHASSRESPGSPPYLCRMSASATSAPPPLPPPASQASATTPSTTRSPVSPFSTTRSPPAALTSRSAPSSRSSRSPIFRAHSSTITSAARLLPITTTPTTVALTGPQARRTTSSCAMRTLPAPASFPATTAALRMAPVPPLRGGSNSRPIAACLAGPTSSHRRS